jgi:hypothetical protein
VIETVAGRRSMTGRRSIAGRRSIGSVPVLLLGLVLMLMSAACDVVGPGDDSVILVNRADVPMVVLVMELGQSYLVDPSPTLELDDGDERILAPGESRRLPLGDISGGFRRGQDLSLFLYDVAGSTAVFTRVRVVRNAELVRRRFILRLP